MLSLKGQPLHGLLLLFLVFLLGLVVGHLTFLPLKELVEERRKSRNDKQLQQEKIETYLNKPAPAIESYTFEGKSWSLDNEIGRTVVLHFWASCCPACQQQMSSVKDLHNMYKEKEDFQMVGICLDSNNNLAGCYRDVNKLTWTHIFDAHEMSNASLARELSIRKIPSLWIVDRSGIIRGMDLNVEDTNKLLKEVMD